ncbi:MAG: type III-A CRISPR-associated protein Csm2 [Candidatus Diapherotrites archaeon]|nr:type III-A CRISPR-associated protein Csm2 [Candidatus Diapherotrites archaeon]
MNKSYFSGREQERSDFSKQLIEFSKKIKNDELSTEVVDHSAKEIAKNIANNRNIKYHQLRRIFSIIKNAKDEKSLVLAKPKIAYQNRIIQNEDFLSIYFDLIELAVKDPEKREFLDQFNEAIICYFKYFNPKGEG